jgi:hypothetical protein
MDTGTQETVTTQDVPTEGTSELESQFQDKPTDDRSPGEQMTHTPEQSAGQTGQQTPGSAGQQPQQVWDGSQWKLKYRDQDVVPKSREELINLAQRGFGYSQAMEKLNKERQGLQARAGQYQQYDQLDKMLKANPALAQKILSAAAEYHGSQQQGSQQPQGQPAYQVPPELQQRIDRIEQEFSKRAASDEDAALDRTLKDLKTKYPNPNWDVDNGSGTLERQLLEFAVENKIRNLDHAYRAMMWDAQQTNVKADVLKQQQEQRVQANKQGIVQGGGTQQPPQARPAYTPNDSYSDLAGKMAAEMRG